MRIRILIVGGLKIMQEGLRCLLEKEDDFEVVAESKWGRRAVNVADNFLPDVVVIDSAMLGMSCIEVTRRIISRAPEARVIVLTTYADRRHIREILNAGARGYLLKERAFEELAPAIRMVSGGGRYLTPSVSGLIAVDSGHGQQHTQTIAAPVLTPREREVLQLISEGRSSAQIAAEMKISVKTVDSHRQHIMDKLDVRGIAELTRYALRHGISHL